MDEIEKLFDKSRGDALNPIIDSEMTEQEAIASNPDMPTPPEIRERLVLLQVEYWGFDNKVHRGQLVIDKDLTEEIKKVFEVALEIRFPLTGAIPAAHPDFKWSDNVLMDKNISSGFNYRKVVNKPKFSQHAYGRAIDINPRLNPYFANGRVYPEDATYNPNVEGTLTKHHPLVHLLKGMGWTWGGDWEETPDYQHFEKKLPESSVRNK